jgi:hypothetical protein
MVFGIGAPVDRDRAFIEFMLQQGAPLGGADDYLRSLGLPVHQLGETA